MGHYNVLCASSIEQQYCHAAKSPHFHEVYQLFCWVSSLRTALLLLDWWFLGALHFQRTKVKRHCIKDLFLYCSLWVILPLQDLAHLYCMFFWWSILLFVLVTHAKRNLLSWKCGRNTPVHLESDRVLNGSYFINSLIWRQRVVVSLCIKTKFSVNVCIISKPIECPSW